MNLRNFGTLFILISLILQNSYFSQNSAYHFKKLTVDDGLSQNSISCIMQDKLGYIWIGTFDGLNRYDGRKILTFRTNVDDSNSISHNRVYKIIEDNNANLWIATEHGLNKYNPQTKKFTRFILNKTSPSKKSNNSIRSLFIDNSDNLWVGTDEGLELFDLVNEKFITEKLSQLYYETQGFRIRDIVKQDNFLWLATGRGMIKCDLKTYTSKWFEKTISGISLNETWKICLDNDKNILASSVAGIISYDKNENNFILDVDLFNSNKVKNNSSAFSIMQDEYNNYWVGTVGNGIIIFNKSTKSFEHLKHMDSDINSLSDDFIYNFYKSRNGSLWIGTYVGGVNIYDMSVKKFHTVRNMRENSNSLINDVIYALIIDVNKDLWIGTSDGLSKYNYAKKTFTNFSKFTGTGFTENRIWALCDDPVEPKKYLWIGTGHGLTKFNKQDYTTKKYYRSEYDETSLSENAIYYLYADSEKQLWIGTSGGGICKYNYKEDNFIRYDFNSEDGNGISGWRVCTIYEDSEKQLWIGTNRGLNKFNRKTNTFEYYLNQESETGFKKDVVVWDIFEDSKNELWIGSESMGLIKFDRNSKTSEVYGSRNKLPNNWIYGILEDNNSNLWVSHNKGISKFNISEKVFTNYYKSHGLQSNEFNHASVMDENGVMYFGGINGYNYFYPDSIRQSEEEPNLRITDIKVFNESIPVGREVKNKPKLKKSIEFLDTVKLSYENYSVTLEFSVLDYHSNSDHEFRYLLDGFNDEWIYSGKTNYATYNLQPGEYLFKVNTTNLNGDWNTNSKELIIIITPPWWETAIFRIIILFCVVVLLYLLHRVRLIKIQNQKQIVLDKNKELNSEIERRKIAEQNLYLAKNEAEKSNKLKSEFLAQVSHEIRTPINVILSFNSLIRDELEQKLDEDLKDGMSAIDRAGKRMIRTIDLILNVSELQTGTYELTAKKIFLFEDVLTDIYEEFIRYASAKDLEFNLVNNTSKVLINIDEYSINQIFINLIDNAIKYTKQGEVKIEIHNPQNDFVIVDVSDTGIGMSEEYLSQIFDPFSQEEQGYTRRYEGTGLGLTLVKNYCELNNCEINVVSEKQSGSKFSVSIPIYKNGK